MKQYFLLSALLIFFLTASAQTVQSLTTKEKISLRGLSVVNNNVIWASGSNGQIARSTDGKNFEWITVKGYEKRDFRDIEAFDANTALIMAVDTPAIILKTKDGGKTWKEVFHDDRKGMFLDAMDFFTTNIGAVIGDPIDGFLFYAMTFDNGDNWSIYKPMENKISLSDGEAFFAASGSNLKFLLDDDIVSPVMITGGKKSKMIVADQSFKLNILQGTESQGANSIDISGRNAVIVGGDFNNDTSAIKNCLLVNLNRTFQFKTPRTPPHGYRSCVAFITQKKLITCGITGVDVSNDGGLNWRLISNESYNVCAKAKKGNAVFLAGKDGRIAKLEN